MEVSITPKMHGMECHVVDQIRHTLGGIGRLMEHWIEQYHQIGFRFDMAYCRVGSLKGQADIRSSVEKRGMHPQVQLCKKMLAETYEGVRKKRKSAEDNKQKAKIIKREKRDDALTQFCAKVERSSESKSKIETYVKAMEDIEDLEEQDEVETKVFGDIE